MPTRALAGQTVVVTTETGRRRLQLVAREGDQWLAACDGRLNYWPCRLIAAGGVVKAASRPQRARRSSSTVYLARVAKNVFKVGVTRGDVGDRIRALQTAAFDPVVVLQQVRVPEEAAYPTEARVKRAFRGAFRRGRGTEVFRVRADEVARVAFLQAVWARR